MNLKTYSNDEGAEFPLFARQCKNKIEAKKMVLNNPMAYRISYLIFKNKRYEMREVYKWK